MSHNSYAHIVAARSLGIRAVTAMDFEHQPANHVGFRLAELLPIGLEQKQRCLELFDPIARLEFIEPLLQGLGRQAPEEQRPAR